MTSFTTAVTGLIKGKVQGVCFRTEAQKKARNFNLTGWARNTDDGDMEVLVVGNKLAVEFMKVWLAKGPSAAMVETVEFVNCEDPGLEDFEVRD